MPDLGDIAVDAFWQAMGPDFESTIRADESLEDWPIENTGSPEAVDAIIRLGEALELPPDRVRMVLRNPETVNHLRVVLAYMKAGRRLRLISHMINAEMTDTSTLRNIFEGDGTEMGDSTAGAIRNSIVVLERKRLLMELFDPDRLDTILNALLEFYEEY